jgi:hypothetical protein
MQCCAYSGHATTGSKHIFAFKQTKPSAESSRCSDVLEAMQCRTVHQSRAITASGRFGVTLKTARVRRASFRVAHVLHEAMPMCTFMTRARASSSLWKLPVGMRARLAHSAKWRTFSNNVDNRSMAQAEPFSRQQYTQTSALRLSALAETKVRSRVGADLVFLTCREVLSLHVIVSRENRSTSYAVGYSASVTRHLRTAMAPSGFENGTLRPGALISFCRECPIYIYVRAQIACTSST